MAPGSPEPLELDLQGRVDHLRLPASNGLMALFEAVINAIQAVEETDPKPSDPIVVRILRRIPTDLKAGEHCPVIGFEVSDPGIGFTDENYKSFKRSDTRRKQVLGGKGVGRLTWLRVFKKTEIISAYAADADTLAQRAFQFTLEGCVPMTADARLKRGTQVHISQPDAAYAPSLDHTTENIAHRIVEHCLVYFVDSKPPRILVTDDLGQSIDLSEFFGKFICKKETTDSFTLKGQSFRVVHLLLSKRRNAGHHLRFCANKRLVRSVKLSDQIPELTQPLDDPTAGEVTYSGYVTGELLDSRVHPERDDFWLGQVAVDGVEGDDSIQVLTFEEIAEGAAGKAKKFLEPLLKPFRDAKTATIQTYVNQEAPQFKYLLNRYPDKVLATKKTDSKALYQHLSTLEFEHDKGVSERMDEALATVDGTKTLEQHQEELENVLVDLSEAAQSKLAKYVLYRRAVINILEKGLAMQPTSGKPVREDAVHQVVFPMRTSSDETPHFSSNLWLLDERLAFHDFLASDMRFAEMKAIIDSGSIDRPDLAIFNRPMAFSDTQGPFQSVVIVDFKRPSRTAYSEGEDEKDPVVQLTGYISTLLAGEGHRKDGAFLKVQPGTPFYAYLIADIPKKLETILLGRGFTKTPDGLGYFDFNQNLNAYIEVISYEKLLRDAKQRNESFFHILGISAARHSVTIVHAGSGSNGKPSGSSEPPQTNGH